MTGTLRFSTDLHFAPHVANVPEGLVQSSFAEAVGDWIELRSGSWEAGLEQADILGALAGIGTCLRKSESRYGVTAVYALKSKPAAVLLADAYDGWWSFTAGGETGEAAERAIAACRALIPEREYGVDPDDIDVAFWMAHPMSVAVSRVRQLPRLPWSQVEGNYPKAVHDTLADLCALTAPPTGGNLILFHGPAGTGKTRFLQTLASEWSPWADVHFVIDPEEMFNTALYLHTVALGEYDTDRYRLIVVEDGDEFIAVDGKKRSGAAVSRLLNVADGLIGQGLKVMVLLSTNVEAIDFSAAIIRTGRCGALVEFPAFAADEADAWAEAHGIAFEDSRPRTLAELYNP